MIRTILLAINLLHLTSARPQETTTETPGSRSSRLLPTGDILSNENSAAITGAALGVGIGVAGSILVGKILDDAAKCKPPAISKFLPLPDILNLNHIVNPDCNNYRQSYPVNYPSVGYNVLPVTSQYDQFSSQSSFTSPHQIQVSQDYLTPDYLQPHLVSGSYQVQDSTPTFSQTGFYTPEPNKDDQHVSSSVHDDYSLLPNAAIQPRSLPEDLFSPVPVKKSSLFSQTAAVVATPDVVVDDDHHARLTVPVVPDLEAGPVRFESRPRQPKILKQSLFSQTAAVVATPDDVVVDTIPIVPDLSGAPVLFQSRPEAKQQSRQGKQLTESLLFKPSPKTGGFTETEAVIAKTDETKNEEASLRSDEPVLFEPRPRAKDESRRGRELNTDPELFTPVHKKSSFAAAFSETEAVLPQPDAPN